MVSYYNDIENAPKAIGPYSQAAQAGNLFFLSGQVPIDPAIGKIVDGGVSDQTEQVMKNLSAVLKGLELEFSNVIETTIFLTDMSDFATVNEVYSKWMGNVRPARATVAVAGLPLGSRVEIKMTAEAKA